jgi:5-methylcytosine-specific restriction endonuclease McrA
MTPEQRREENRKNHANLSESFKERHRAKMREYSKRYYAEHKDERKVRIANWSPERKAKKLAQTRQSYHRDLAKSRDGKQAAAERRRARIMGNGGRGITTGEWQAIKAEQGHRCAYCGTPSQRLTMDHVVPLIRGGRHEASNIVAACRRCNAVKGPKLLSEL